MLNVSSVVLTKNIIIKLNHLKQALEAQEHVSKYILREWSDGQKIVKDEKIYIIVQKK